MEDNNPQMRSIAAKWLYSATGETNRTLPVIKEAVSHVETEEHQFLISVIAELGERAHSPTDLEPFLTHPERWIRYAAGKALRSIDSIEVNK